MAPSSVQFGYNIDKLFSVLLCFFNSNPTEQPVQNVAVDRIWSFFVYVRQLRVPVGEEVTILFISGNMYEWDIET